MVNKQIVGLARIVHDVFKKKFSKYNQESAWSQRPLRKGQLHYAALDALAALKLLKHLRETGGQESTEVPFYNFFLPKDFWGKFRDK